jgi:ATP-binding cassette subfamily C protein
MRDLRDTFALTLISLKAQVAPARIVGLLALIVAGAALDVLVALLVTLYASSIAGSKSAALLAVPYNGGIAEIAVVLLWLAAILKFMSVLAGQYLGFQTALRVHDAVASKLMSNYLHQPYEYHLARNSTNLVHNVIHLPYALSFDIVLPTISIMAELITLFVFLAIVAFISPIMLAAAAALALCGFLIFAVARPVIVRKGRLGFEAAHRVRQLIVNSLGSVKEVKIYRAERYFSQRFSQDVSHLAHSYVFLPLLQRLSHAIVEFALLAAMIGGLAFLGRNDTRFFQYLPLIAVAMIVGLRVFPIMVRVSNYIQSVQFDRFLVDQLVHDLALPAPAPAQPRSDFATIELRDVTHRYEGQSEPALRKASLRLRRGDLIAITGRSGAGKSTLADIVLGLIEPRSGQVLIDGAPASSHSIRAGYVPQAIFLADEPLRRNIAFGEEDGAIDPERLAKAVHDAHLDSVVARLAGGLNASCGERGARLSGGERQRVAIARALYQSPDLIVLDEATSGLDFETKQEILTTIESLHGKVTMIMITHDPQIAEICDRVVTVNEGMIQSDSRVNHTPKIALDA